VLEGCFPVPGPDQRIAEACRDAGLECPTVLILRCEGEARASKDAPPLVQQFVVLRESGGSGAACRSDDRRSSRHPRIRCKNKSRKMTMGSEGRFLGPRLRGDDRWRLTVGG
jgi:hypothetical protein